MKKLISILLITTLILSFTACGNGAGQTAGDVSDTQKTTKATTPTSTTETPATTDPSQENEKTLWYYNDVASIFYSGIEMYYNNRFDDAVFVCVVNMKDGTWEITDSEVPQGFSDMISYVISDVQAREFKSGPKATGTILVKYEYGLLHYVQYTEVSAGAVKIIGQYSDPAKVADGHIEWGVFHNRTRCDICANA